MNIFDDHLISEKNNIHDSTLTSFSDESHWNFIRESAILRYFTGKQFNMHPIYGKKIYFKLLNVNETHFGFKYKDGLNVDTTEFLPYGSCSGGGLYFSEFDKIHKWAQISYYGKDNLHFIRKVTIPDDAKVFVEENKFKADKFILDKRIVIWNDYEICMKLVSNNKFALKFVNKDIIDEKICKASVEFNCHSLAYVPKKFRTLELCNYALNVDGTTLFYVPREYRTYDICLNAVKKTGRALVYVPPEILDENIKQTAIKNYFWGTLCYLEQDCN